MKPSRFTWVGIVALSLWAATVYAHPRGGMGSLGPGRMMGDAPGMMLPLVLKGVDLTDAQEKQVRDIMAAHRATFRTLFGELQAAHKEVADKLFAPGDVGAEDLTTQMQRVAQLREQLMQEGLKVTLEVRAVLTPEQLAKAAELKDRMRALHTEMRGLFKEKH
ncbi:MAG TPA: Spy/CpxP family protein refolding chaperone [Candidatus Tectomicrobia bacterium]|nr:Spy/CpxP family protein refolding chaperone [Candidatus Tectomicrobia bacterium]